jgi:hypothetical protein
LVAVALAAIAVAELTLTGCGQNPRDPRAAATRQRLELAAGAPSRSRTPIPVAVGPLARGTYATTVFTPRLTFSIDDGWIVLAEYAGLLALSTKDGKSTLDFVAAADAFVLDPPVGSPVESEADIRARARPMPRDYIDFLRTVKYIEVGSTRPVTVAGVRARAVDYAVRSLPSAAGSCANGQPGACFEPLGIRPTMVDPQRLGSATRVVEVDDASRTIVTLLYTADPAAASPPLSRADAILTTLRIGS